MGEYNTDLQFWKKNSCFEQRSPDISTIIPFSIQAICEFIFSSLTNNQVEISALSEFEYDAITNNQVEISALSEFEFDNGI